METLDKKMTIIKLNNAYFANKHISKQIPVKDESWGLVEFKPNPNKKGHLTWIPF